jgi:hypothetical protein
MTQEGPTAPGNPAGNGAPRENREGWAPPLATEDDIRAALEHAHDYRGDVTITCKDGTVVEGYIFDRRLGPTLSQCAVRLFPKDGTEKKTIPYDQITAVVFTGRDTAVGRSWETWLKKYHEKKAAGEKNIGLDAEKLD